MNGAFAWQLRSAARFHRAHPVELVLAVLGIALGVAVVVAMDLAIESARESFRVSSEAVFGRTTHSISSDAGGIDEALYVTLRTRARDLPSAPVVEGAVSTIAPEGAGATIAPESRRLTLLGVDLFAESDFRSHTPRPAEGSGALLGQLMTRPGRVLASRETLAMLGWSPGQRVDVRVAEREVALEVIGELVPRTRLEALGLESVLVTDIASAQEILARHGQLTRIDLNLAGVADEHAALERIRALIPPGAALETAASRSRAASSLTAAFYLNLRMLSLLALVVGLFIIYNAMTFAVVRRRRIIGRLRAIGVTAREILIATFGEASALAILGCIVGVPLGIALGGELLELLSRTVDDLYYPTRGSQVLVSPDALLRGTALALGGALVASLLPALEATRVAPRAAMADVSLERRVQRRAPWLAAIAAFMLAACPVLIAITGKSLGASFLVLLLLVLAGALVAPFTVIVVSRIVHAMGTRRLSPPFSFGLRGLAAGVSRTGVAVAALAVALATTIGMAVMVDSFRGSFKTWLETTLEADLYLGLGDRETAQRIDDALAADIAALPGVAGVSVSSDREVSVAGASAWLKAVESDGKRYRDLVIMEGRRDPWAAIAEPETIVVSESLAWRHAIVPGASLQLRTDRGEVELKVASIYRDYGSERGMLLMSQRSYRALFDQRGYNGLGIHLESEVAPDALVSSIERLASRVPAAQLRSHRFIREASFEIFERTFLITRVMQWLATLVASVGVVSALMALALERSREFAVLRAQGMTRRELFAVLQLQNLLLGATAGLLACPLGIAMARVLVDVVNRRAFGWSMEFDLGAPVLLTTVTLAIAAALVAGAYPGWRMANTPPAEAMREGR